MPVHYRITPSLPEAHLFDVTLTLDSPALDGQIFSLPCWIPGSYLIREFARHIVAISAHSQGRPLQVTKLDKQRWQLAPARGPVTLSYQVYAWDLSVRGAYLDTTRGFFNGTSVFMVAQGHENETCEVEILPPAGEAFKEWEVATSLPRAGAKAWQFGRYRAENYDDLIDHPVEMGCFSRIAFKACGVPHDLVISGRHDADLRRLKKDIKKICEAQIRFFGEPAPFERYVFLTVAVGDGYGGLEHRTSTALICARDDLPMAHEAGMSLGYRKFLGLVSHEYFHAWNVKRIKPATFAPYELDREGYTRLLWAFEGITSYYDDLFLLRAGLISRQEYLDLLAQTMTAVQRNPGRKVQTLEDSSFDAWIKYYRQDENSPNSQVSYYAKGALAALCLDLTLRLECGKSLDDVMRALWLRFGKDFSVTGKSVAETEWEAVAQEISGVDLSGFFDNALRTTNELPVAELLGRIGLQSQLRPSSGASDKGGWLAVSPKSTVTIAAQTANDAGAVKLTQILQNGPAQRAGLAAGDILVALNGLRVTYTNLESMLARCPAGKKQKLLAFRRDELMSFDIKPELSEANTWGVKMDEANEANVNKCNSWLR